MAATLPLVQPVQYDPCFKVDVRLHEPLLCHVITQTNVEVDMMTHCSQLDILCRKELGEQPGNRIDHGKVSHSFATKVSVVMDRMQQVLEKANNSLPLQTYIQEQNVLKTLFPRAVAVILQLQKLNMTYDKMNLDDYFPQLARLNQVLTLAFQIRKDLTAGKKQKHIAHQVALLYQSVNSLGNTNAYSVLKKNIEDNFRILKASMPGDGDTSSVELSSEIQIWLQELIAGISSLCLSLPAEVMSKALQPAHHLAHS